MTPELFDTLIVANLMIGLTLGAVRFYQDMSRPLSSKKRYLQSADEDTQPHRPQESHPLTNKE